MADFHSKILHVFATNNFSTLTQMILVFLSLNVERNIAVGVSTKTLYMVSTDDVNYHIAGWKNCFQRGGILINLESPYTTIFLEKLRTSMGYKNEDVLYYTGLRYNIKGEVFYWADENCTLATAEEVRTYTDDFDPRRIINQSFQIRYVPDSTGTLGEAFHGYWDEPGTDSRIICQIETSEGCSFIEKVGVTIDPQLEKNSFADVDLNTCRSLCLDTIIGSKECLIYQLDDLGLCTIWFGERGNDPRDVMLDGPYTVHYKDCVRLEFFQANDFPGLPGFKRCQPVIPRPADTTTTSSLDTSTMDSGYFSIFRSASGTSTDSSNSPNFAMMPGDFSKKLLLLPAALPPEPEEVTALERPVEQSTTRSPTDGTEHRVYVEGTTTLGDTESPSSTQGNQFSVKATDTQLSFIRSVFDEDSTKRATEGFSNKLLLLPAALPPEPEPEEVTALDRPAEQSTTRSLTDGTEHRVYVEGTTTLGDTESPSSTQGNQFSVKATDTQLSFTRSVFDEDSTKRGTEGLDPASKSVSTVEASLSPQSDSMYPDDIQTPAIGAVSMCPCECGKGSNDNQEEKAEFTAEILSNLTIDTKNTSANTRKYVSAKDDRPSAIRIGGFGAIFLGVILSIPVLFDLCNLLMFITNVVKRSRGRTNMVDITISPD